MSQDKRIIEIIKTPLNLSKKFTKTRHQAREHLTLQSQTHSKKYFQIKNQFIKYHPSQTHQLVQVHCLNPL
ncbi:uncharacterized protein MELLADRAFT_88053 [Melampsora larici-populina 98AG31]|uniref:Uncharacterized protein n=1 Tax=Melampsora larici-populina (strain 98AG31 / pathotype 3-4-7) TaxID=747676 RepID=F4RQ95_MELLP|nr:uncharacterized protein MELLADRAFT_88053 [Melampsora larici-populina 98AG31]EGG05365.1 hypothetical protein MELLADRAFT_88053 [Melampsora larici-populina 98AG31]